MNLSEKQLSAMRLIAGQIKARNRDEVDMSGLVHLNTLKALERRRYIEIHRIPTEFSAYKQCGFSWRTVTTKKVRVWVRFTSSGRLEYESRRKEGHE